MILRGSFIPSAVSFTGRWILFSIFKKMYRHGLLSNPLGRTPSLARYYVACNGNLHPLYVNMPLSLMRAGSWRLCRSVVPRNCCIRKVLPVLLHPEVPPFPPSQVLLPLPLLGSEFLAFIRIFVYYCGVGSSSFSAITSTCVERRYLTATQGVYMAHVHYPGPTVTPIGYLRVLVVLSPEVLPPESAAVPTIPCFYPHYHWAVGCHLVVPG